MMESFWVFGQDGWIQVRGYVVSSEIAFSKNNEHCPWTITHLPTGLALVYLDESCLIEQVADVAWQIATAHCDWSDIVEGDEHRVPQLVRDYIAAVRWNERRDPFPEMAGAGNVIFPIATNP